MYIVQAAVLVLTSQALQQTEKHGALGLMCETPPFLCLRQASYPLTSRTHQMWSLFEMCDHLTELKRCLEKEVYVCVFFCFVARGTGNTPNDISASYLNSYIGYSCRRPSLSNNQMIARHPQEPSSLLSAIANAIFFHPQPGWWVDGRLPPGKTI